MYMYIYMFNLMPVKPSSSFCIMLSLWSSLGFYRGINSYTYDHKKNQKRYERSKDIYSKPQYFYLDCFGTGIFATMIYICPATFPFVLYKEAQRIEINIRNLNDTEILDEYYKIV